MKDNFLVITCINLWGLQNVYKKLTIPYFKQETIKTMNHHFLLHQLNFRIVTPFIKWYSIWQNCTSILHLCLSYQKSCWNTSGLVLFSFFFGCIFLKAKKVPFSNISTSVYMIKRYYVNGNMLALFQACSWLCNLKLLALWFRTRLSFLFSILHEKEGLSTVKSVVHQKLKSVKKNIK